MKANYLKEKLKLSRNLMLESLKKIDETKHNNEIEVLVDLIRKESSFFTDHSNRLRQLAEAARYMMGFEESIIMNSFKKEEKK